MIHSVFAAATEWVSPQVDYHALAPEIILATGLGVVLLADLFLDESRKWIISSLTGFTLLGAMLPVLTLGLNEASVRSLFDGRYVVDEFSVVMKAMFLIAGYVVVLLSTKHVEEDEYWQGEYWFLLLSSILGMVMMASSRDLVSIRASGNSRLQRLRVASHCTQSQHIRGASAGRILVNAAE